MHAWIKDRQKFRILLSTIGLYIVTITLALVWRNASFAAWFLVPLSILHLYFYGIIHELTHNNIFARVKPNIWMGHVLCPLNLVYFHTFKTIHLQHHRFVQIPEVDPVYAEERRYFFQPPVVSDHLALSCRALVCPAYCPAPQPPSFTDQLPGLHGWYLQSLCPWSGIGVLWTMLFFWGSPCLYWDGVSDWYSEPD